MNIYIYINIKFNYMKYDRPIKQVAAVWKQFVLISRPKNVYVTCLSEKFQFVE